MAEQYIYPCWLISKNEDIVSDDVGNLKVARKKRKVLASKISVSGRELYQGNALGIEVKKTIKVREFEYKGETEADFEGDHYYVKSINDSDDGRIKLLLYKGVSQQNAIAKESYQNQ